MIKYISFLPDPCPLPDKQKKRSLNEKERLIYAPMCGVGGIVYDKDAVYIETKESKQENNAEVRVLGKQYFLWAYFNLLNISESN